MREQGLFLEDWPHQKTVIAAEYVHVGFGYIEIEAKCEVRVVRVK